MENKNYQARHCKMLYIM